MKFSYKVYEIYISTNPGLFIAPPGKEVHGRAQESVVVPVLANVAIVPAVTELFLVLIFVFDNTFPSVPLFNFHGFLLFLLTGSLN